MLKIIYNTPIYVWPLLALLIWGGWKSRKTYIVAWKDLLIMPIIMFFWSVYVVLARYDTFPIYFWIASMLIGVWLGRMTVRKIHLEFDKQKNLIQIEGSWMPMILSISIFSLRYILGATYGMHPELAGNGIFFLLENAAIVVSGMFVGRVIGYWQRFKASYHTDLSEIKA